MATQSPTQLLISIFVALTWIQTRVYGLDQPQWAKRVESDKEVVTNLQFFFHDTVSGNSPSAIRIAQASQTNNSLTGFGSLLMVDDPLTVGPESTSKLVGRAKGIYGSAGQSELGLVMAMAYCFEDDIYKGSSFSVMSINQVMQPTREMAIVGGTGLFRMARGYVIAHTNWFNLAGDAIVGYNATIVTYI